MTIQHDKVDVLIVGLRRVGGGGGVEPGRHAHAHPLPGAGRLGALDRLPGQRPRLGGAARDGGDWDIRPNFRGRDTDYPVNDDNSIMKVANFNGVGGGTVIYTAHWPRLHPSDFRVKSLDGVADDWPIDYWTLERFYEENDRMMGVVRPRRAIPACRRAIRRCRRSRSGKTGTHYGRAMNKLGWHWWPSDTSIATQPYEGRAQCINLGHCTPGCAQGAKASTDITYWPLAHRAWASSCARAAGCARSRSTSERHGVRARSTTTPRAQEHFQPAELVIMACNGVGTPRLLLNSASAQFPNGLANSSGLVGKNLMLHPWPVVSGYVAGDARRRARADHLAVEQAVLRDRPVARLRARLHAAVQPRRRPGQPGARAASAAGHLPWGRDHHRVYRELLDHRVGIGVACDDLPEEHNRVTLDPVLKDSNGIPAPKIDYTISENTHAHDGARHRPRRGDPRRRAARRRIHCSREVLNYPGHLLGTARMGTDPERSVVNEWGRSHDVKNLFIVDGSVFVTGGGVNPTSTHPGDRALHRRPDEAAAGDVVRLASLDRGLQSRSESTSGLWRPRSQQLRRQAGVLVVAEDARMQLVERVHAGQRVGRGGLGEVGRLHRLLLGLVEVGGQPAGDRRVEVGAGGDEAPRADRGDGAATGRDRCRRAR